MINAFKDVTRSQLPEKEGMSGQSYLDNILALQVGHGSTTMKSNKYGLWMGSKNFQNAPFYVDMSGNVVASSINLGGAYVAAGGAAADINANSTLVSGGKLVSLSITSTQIADNAISTPKLQANSVVANVIASNAVVASKISAGAVEADKIATNAVTANKIQAGAVSADKISVSNLAAINANLGTITAGSINAALVTITNLNANNITTGTIRVGASGQPDAIILSRDTGGTGTKLRWEPGGSRMWADTSNRIGINSIGSPMFIYVNSSEKLAIPQSGQTSMRGGIFCDGNLNVADNQTIRIQQFGHLQMGNFRLEGGFNRYVFKDGDGNERFSITPDSSPNTRINMNGYSLRLTSNKTAIMPVDDGYKALYCIESPEVWFMDFRKVDEMEDETFTKVTDGKRFYQKVFDEDGVEYVQVWRRRKGHADLRFEDKTEEEFIQNEKFLRLAKPEGGL